jgi:hypothetical protein
MKGSKHDWYQKGIWKVLISMKVSHQLLKAYIYIHVVLALVVIVQLDVKIVLHGYF